MEAHVNPTQSETQAVNVALCAGGQDGGRLQNEHIGMIISSKNISDTGEGNSKINGLLPICSQGSRPHPPTLVVDVAIFLIKGRDF